MTSDDPRTRRQEDDPDELGALLTADLLRRWRHHRALSAEALAAELGLSAAGIRAWETAREPPTRPELVRLCAALGIPPTVARRLLGDAPRDEPAPDHADLAHVRPPNLPTLVARHDWDVVRADPAFRRLVDGAGRAALAPAPNVLRLLLHPDGLLGRLEGARGWRARVLADLRREVLLTEDGALAALHHELSRLPLPGPQASDAHVEAAADPVLVLRVGGRREAWRPFVGTLSCFGEHGDHRLVSLVPAELGP